MVLNEEADGLATRHHNRGEAEHRWNQINRLTPPAPGHAPPPDDDEETQEDEGELELMDTHDPSYSTCRRPGLYSLIYQCLKASRWINAPDRESPLLSWRTRLLKWSPHAPISNLLTLIARSRQAHIPPRYRWVLSRTLLDEVPTEGRAGTRSRGPRTRPACAMCGLPGADGLRHLLALGCQGCAKWQLFVETLTEELDLTSPALTSDLFHHEGDTSVKLRLLYVLNTMYRWSFQHGWGFTMENFRIAWYQSNRT